MGCGRRLGCLILCLVVAAVAWLARDRWAGWLPRVRSWVGEAPHASPARAAEEDTVSWRALTLGGASHAERLILSLGDRGSPAYTMMLPADFASFMLMDVAGRVPPPEDSTAAAVIDRALAVRTSVDIRALGGRTAFGPLGGLLADREPLTLAGTFDVVRPGVAEFHVQRLSVHGLPVPSPLIPPLVHKVEIGAHPAGLAPDALLLNVPRYVSDIRIVGDRVAVYRSVP